mgnify:CR=1 FL=1
MSEPCAEKENIVYLKATARAQHESLTRIETVLTGINISLQELAAQRIEIKHLHGEMNDNKQAIDGLFKRVRHLELAPGKTGAKVFWVAVTAMAGIIGGLVTSFIRYAFGGSI